MGRRKEEQLKVDPKGEGARATQGVWVSRPPVWNIVGGTPTLLETESSCRNLESAPVNPANPVLLSKNSFSGSIGIDRAKGKRIRSISRVLNRPGQVAFRQRGEFLDLRLGPSVVVAEFFGEEGSHSGGGFDGGLGVEEKRAGAA